MKLPLKSIQPIGKLNTLTISISVTFTCVFFLGFQLFFTEDYTTLGKVNPKLEPYYWTKYIIRYIIGPKFS